MVWKTLYYILLDICKTCDTVVWERQLEILEGYGVGPRPQRFVARSRNYQMKVVVSKCVVIQEGGVIFLILI